MCWLDCCMCGKMDFLHYHINGKIELNCSCCKKAENAAWLRCSLCLAQQFVKERKPIERESITVIRWFVEKKEQADRARVISNDDPSALACKRIYKDNIEPVVLNDKDEYM